MHAKSIIDDSSNDYFAENKYVDHDCVNLFDDEAHDDINFSDDLTRESTEDARNSSDTIDDRTDEYDYSDSFIDDGSLVDETSQDDEDSYNSDD